MSKELKRSCLKKKVWEGCLIQYRLSIERLKLFKKKKKQKQSHLIKLKSTINEMKNSPEWLNSRSGQGEESICKLKDTSTEIRQSEEQKEKRLKTNEQRPMGHHQVCQYMHNGNYRRGDRERGRKKILKK